MVGFMMFYAISIPRNGQIPCECSIGSLKRQLLCKAEAKAAPPATEGVPSLPTKLGVKPC
jgi:hypothetical protein